MSGGRDYDQERLAELIVYIADRLIGDPRFGATKLHKVLFFSDFEAYRRTGQSITGAVYQHLPQGPCARQFLPVVDSLLQGADVIWRHVDSYGRTQKQLIPLRPARVELFTGTEIAIVDDIIDDLRHMTNQQASDLSHDTMAWRLTANRDEIPYGAALLSTDEPTAEDLAWVEEIARREGMESTAG